MAAAMRLVLPAHAGLPGSGSKTPTLAAPLLPACARAADGAGSSSAPASAARWLFILILPIASVCSSSHRTHLAKPGREFLFRRPCDHGCIADRGEEIARNIVAVARHDPWHAGLVGKLRDVAHRTRTIRQHDPTPRGAAHDLLPAAAQNRSAFHRNPRTPR